MDVLSPPEMLCELVQDDRFAQSFAEILLENYYNLDFPALTAMAEAHKIRHYKDSFYGDGKDKYPHLADCATYFFETLFPEKDSNYYKVINGIVKHSPDISEEDMQKFEDSIVSPKYSLKQKEIKKIKDEIAQLKLQLDILENL